MSELFVELERLAQAFPWDKEVSIWTNRKAEGRITYTVFISGDDDSWHNPKARKSVSGHGKTAAEAVDDAIKEGGQTPRDPETRRQVELAKLREDIKKLEDAVFPALPPYVPNRELCEKNPQLRASKAIGSAPIEA